MFSVEGRHVACWRPVFCRETGWIPDWFLCFYLVNSVFIGVSGADLFLSVFWQIGELDVGAALRLNDTLTSLQPVCIRSTLPPPRRRSRRSRPLKHTLCKQLRLRTFQPKLRRVWKKQCPFWFCLSNNRRGRARYNNRPWHYVQSSHSSSAFLGQMKRLARRNGFPQPVTLIRRCFNCLGRERHMYLIIYLLFNHIRLTLLSFVQMAAWEQGFTTSYFTSEIIEQYEIDVQGPRKDLMIQIKHLNSSSRLPFPYE